MFYTIYKITNKINGKIYVGKHQTKDLNDSYMGSGINIRRAINKYGIENFEKEILFIFETEVEMNAKEAEIVNEDFVNREDVYNICYGGHGGFGYINNSNILKMHGKKQSDHQKNVAKETMLELNERLKNDVKMRSMWLKSVSERKNDHFKGKTHTEETKKKMQKSKNNGEKNSQFGTMWITDGYNNKKIKKDVVNMPEGWYKGRSLKTK